MDIAVPGESLVIGWVHAQETDIEMVLRWY